VCSSAENNSPKCSGIWGFSLISGYPTFRYRLN